MLNIVNSYLWLVFSFITSNQLLKTNNQPCAQGMGLGVYSQLGKKWITIKIRFGLGISMGFVLSLFTTFSRLWHRLIPSFFKIFNLEKLAYTLIPHTPTNTTATKITKYISGSTYILYLSVNLNNGWWMRSLLG